MEEVGQEEETSTMLAEPSSFASAAFALGRIAPAARSEFKARGSKIPPPPRASTRRRKGRTKWRSPARSSSWGENLLALYGLNESLRSSDFTYLDRSIADVKLLRNGPNVLAVHCKNENAAQCIDAGLIEVIEPYEAKPHARE